MKSLFRKILFRLIGAFFLLPGVISLIFVVQFFRGKQELRMEGLISAIVIIILTLPLGLFFLRKAHGV
jgi:ABC-type dipeptide/oligopeptide/nickel transport system permease subunit